MSVLLIACASDPSSGLEISAALARAGWRDKLAIVSPNRCTKIRLDAVCGVVLSDGDVLDDRRDALEFPLVAWAWERQLPLLALGRGAYIVDAARGGAPRGAGCVGATRLGAGLRSRACSPRGRRVLGAALGMFEATEPSRWVVGVWNAAGALACAALQAFVAEAIDHGARAEGVASRFVRPS